MFEDIISIDSIFLKARLENEEDYPIKGTGVGFSGRKELENVRRK